MELSSPQCFFCFYYYYYSHYSGDATQLLALQHCYAPLVYPYGTSTLSSKWSELV